MSPTMIVTAGLAAWATAAAGKRRVVIDMFLGMRAAGASSVVRDTDDFEITIKNSSYRAWSPCPARHSRAIETGVVDISVHRSHLRVSAT
jgi:hypothetical protein